MKRTIEYGNKFLLSFADYGDPRGYPILIQHGLIASITDYIIFERLIRAGKRLICVARPGYGVSSPYLLNSYAEWADIVENLIQECSLSCFDILGMSSGAPYSYAIGWKFPKSVRNIFIFSGIPALYDEKVRELWPYPIIHNASIEELEILSRQLFFSGLSPEVLEQEYIRDSIMNNCFGVAQDFRLRFMDWGFSLADVSAEVVMEHSKDDSDVPFETAVITSRLLPKCTFRPRESGGHFSAQCLDKFIDSVMVVGESHAPLTDKKD